MWSTLTGYLQHMPALPKTPKILEIVPMQSLFRDAFGKKNSKNLKIVWDQVTLPKTGLSLVGTIRLLEVNHQT
jgi:hypothetical protein